MERTTGSSKKPFSAEKMDRLSALPDDLICRILSRLQTKRSVSTSVLAKRWRFLWAHVPDLDFYGEINPDVIHRVMGRHKVKTMTSFGLYDMSHCNEYQLETWITTAIERNVQNLYFFRVTSVLPMCIFTCKTLVRLILQNCGCIRSNGAPFHLPSLKSLYLRRVTFQAEETVPCLLSGCPVLELLDISTGKDGPNLGCYEISSPSIKKLVFRSPRVTDNREVRVVINAPALRYLNLITFGYDQISLSPMTSLIEADLSLHGSSVLQRNSCTLSVRKLFYCFPNVKCLILRGRCKEDEFPVADSIVKFDKLTKLDLGVDWCFLTKFLETADNLQELIIRDFVVWAQNKIKFLVHDNRKIWIEPKKELILRSLRIVTIHHFCFTEQELNLVKYILRNAKVLKRMEIHSGSNCVDSKETTNDTRKRILLFHRGSTECEVAFVWD